MDVASPFFPKTNGVRPQKRRPATYGKATRTTNYTLSKLEASPAKPKPVAAQVWSPESSPPAISKPSTGKLKRPSPKRQRDEIADVFDVPPSDDEHITPPKPKRMLLSPSPRPRRPVRDKTKSRNTSRDSDCDSTQSASQKRKRDTDSADVQLLRESGLVPAHAVKSHSRTSPKGKEPAKPAVKPMSARAAHIPAKTKQSIQFKTGVKTGQQTTLLQKQRPMTQKRTAMLPKPLKGVSAPGQLERMIASGATTRQIRSPTKNTKSDSSSSPRTPSSRASVSPPSIIRSGSATPKQNALWSKLLESEDATDSPSKLAVQNLRISGSSKTSAQRTLLRSATDIARPAVGRRGRLIDTLAKPNDDEEDGEESFDQTTSTEDEHESMDLSSDRDMIQSQPMEIDLPAASLSQGGPRFTYGQQRTYIEENNLELELMLDSPLVVSKQSSGVGYGSQKTASQSQSKYSQEDEDLEESQGPIKSVHELRAAGENQRFVDDFENILEDIQHRGGKSMSRQRTGIVELCEKLSDKKFVGRMVDQGLDERLLKACSGVSDTIFNFAMAVAIAYISDSDAPLAVLRHIQKSESFDMLFSFLELDADIKAIGKERRTNMSKVAQTSLSEFRAKVFESPIWEEQKPAMLSPHVMALKGIDLLIRNLRRKGHMDDLLNEQNTSTLLAILEGRLKPAASPAKPDLISLELALSILESGSIIPGRIQTAWTPKRLDRLATLLPKLLCLDTTNADRLRELALRLMLNLTNNNAKSSMHFANNELLHVILTTITDRFDELRAIPESTEDDQAAVVNRLVLYLGALINLAEFCDSARTAVLVGDGVMLDGLLAYFVQQHTQAAEADSLQASQLNIPYGWLSVALGNLCQNAQVRRHVQLKLPGKTLKPVIDAIEEFVQHHRKVDMFEGEEGDAVSANFTQRLKDVAMRLKESDTA
ncbi:hypothetical protein NA57DRAFT_79668 [Rhizodiscina lignyota]|uniref:Wings apart-like protein C-terminal domain-containing protein n=1 Tax=Rhizodiscina lignyota TaxID=1504668 RepID=A0A9P4I959_9PEZI|nr:hypothetical protein NA57DRAFT_79668 [Rhizodiscina lignyota]